MMQSQNISRISSYAGLKLCITGHLVQVRNHVKMYPWRGRVTNQECYLDTTKTPYTDKHNINEFRPNKGFKAKPWMKVVHKDKDNRFNKYRWHEAYTSDPVEAKETATSRLNRFITSVESRGSARPQRTFSPPDNVQEIIFGIFNELLTETDGAIQADQTQIISAGSNEESIKAVDLNLSREFKADMIKKCMAAFEHDLSSATLNDVTTIGDLIDFYSKPVRGIDPYSELVSKSDSLPPNLTILSESIRFDKETDQHFGGYTAYPGSVNSVPGLRAKKKYQILNQDEFQWPDI